MSKTVYENEDIFATEADGSGIPDYALSFAEQSLYVTAMVEENFLNMEKELGINEFCAYEESGEEFIYEGATFQAAKDKIIAAFKYIWSKIRGAYEKLLNKVKDAKKKAIEEFAKQADPSKLPEGFKPRKAHEFTGLTTEFINKISANTNALADKVAEYNNGSGMVDIGSYKEMIDNLDFAVELGKNGVISGTASTYEELRQELKKELEGDVVEFTADKIKSNWKDIEAAAKTKGEFYNIVKAAYKNEKKTIDKMVSTIRKIKETDAAVLKVLSAKLKDIYMGSHSILFTVMDVCKKRDTEYTSILVAVAKATGGKAKDAKEEEPKNESVQLGTTQKDLIEASFEW